MALAVGTKAPDFTLKSKSPADVEVKLSNNFGKKNTVLLFFPLAFTGVCTTEMCDVTAGLSAYAGMNADVIAISVDSPFAQAAWAQKEKIGITLASDLKQDDHQGIRCCVSHAPPASATPPPARRLSLINMESFNTAKRRRRRKTCRTSTL